MGIGGSVGDIGLLYEGRNRDMEGYRIVGRDALWGHCGRVKRYEDMISFNGRYIRCKDTGI